MNSKNIFFKRINSEQLSLLTVYLCTLLVLLAGFNRYYIDPSFWLDEAFVAISLKNTSLLSTFTRLQNGQYFPRIYLLCIHLLIKFFGYKTLIIRALPFISFIVGTILWMKIIYSKYKKQFCVQMLGSVLLLGSIFWLEQSSQLKQYTFDVMLCLIPFFVTDDLWKKFLTEKKYLISLILLTLLCCLSYPYPIAFGSRIIGVYLVYRREIKLNFFSVGSLFAFGGLSLLSVYKTDHIFNIKDILVYKEYWSTSILSICLSQGTWKSLRLLMDFFAGWYGKLFTLALFLQLIGIYLACRNFLGKRTESSQYRSLSFCSVILFGSVILASLVANYPISTGRLILFTQIHSQILLLDGFSFLLSKKYLMIKSSLVILFFIFGLYSSRSYFLFIKSEPPENLRTLIPYIKSEITDTAWISPCSIYQVDTLPEGLPVSNIVKSRTVIPKGKVWIISTHMGTDFCVDWLEQAHSKSTSWKEISNGNNRKLILAEIKE